MRKIGLMLVLSLCCLATANATTFTLAGDGGLTGTVTIDTTTGAVTALSVSFGGDTFSSAMGANGPYFLGPGIVHIEGLNGPKTKFLHLLIQATSLVGYAGGNLLVGSLVYCIQCPIPSQSCTECVGTLVQLTHATLL